MVDKTEATLVQQVLSGKTECYRPLVDKYQKKVFMLAYSFIGNANDAQDIAQEAFLAAYKQLSGLKDRTKFGSWLFGITRNLCKSQLRKRMVEPEFLDCESDEEISKVVSMRPSTENGLDLIDMLILRMERLPEKYRVILRLKYLEDYSYQEISEMMHIPIDLVRSRLFEGRRLLRERLKKAHRSMDYGQ
ncbi:sigma-70 family RNA polymerase sigma factor [bacterium]|nr:sigma-70 family RNA polymerase sigma factor [bacterium]